MATADELRVLMHQPLKRWTDTHLDALKVAVNLNCRTGQVFDASYLPADGDDVFEKLVVECAKQMREDLTASGSATPAPNPLQGIPRRYFPKEYQELLEERDAHERATHIPMTILQHLLDGILTSLNIKESLEIKIARNGVSSPGMSSSMRVFGGFDGAIYMNESELPLVILVVANKLEDKTGSIPLEFGQVMTFATMAYYICPALVNRRFFVLCLNGTVLHVSTVTFRSAYMQDLRNGKPPSQGCQYYASKYFDLNQEDGRKEGLRLLIGLFQFLDADYGLSEQSELSDL